MGETISDHVRRRTLTLVLLSAWSFATMALVCAYGEYHRGFMSEHPLTSIGWIVLVFGAPWCLLSVAYIRCPRCRRGIGSVWIQARLRREVGRCPRCRTRFDQPRKISSTN